MSKIGLDLSKFKKTASTDNNTTLQHQDGHRLTIDHSKLPSKMLSALNKLPLMEQENSLPENGMADGGNTYPTPLPSSNQDNPAVEATDSPDLQAPEPDVGPQPAIDKDENDPNADANLKDLMANAAEPEQYPSAPAAPAPNKNDQPVPEENSEAPVSPQEKQSVQDAFSGDTGDAG